MQETSLVSLYTDDTSWLDHGCFVQLDGWQYRVLKIWDEHRVLLCVQYDWDYELDRFNRFFKYAQECLPLAADSDIETFYQRILLMDRGHRVINWGGPLIRVLYSVSTGVVHNGVSR